MPLAAWWVPLVPVAIGVLALAVFVAYLRLFGPRLVDYYYADVLSEAPITVTDRIEHAIEPLPHYTYRRVGQGAIEIIRADWAPDEYAEKQMPELAGAVLDFLRATTRRVDSGTEVVLVGRAERRVIRAIRQALARAPRPSE